VTTTKTIDQASLHLDPPVAVIMTVMVGFLVFSVALDLEWEHFRRVLTRPKAPLIGLLAQFGLLPAVAFGVATLTAATPSVALGLVLVSCCPGGPLSNYLTGSAKGNVATSVTMTAVSTASCVVITPLVFALWTSLDPELSALVRTINVDVRKVLLSLLVMVALPVPAAMRIAATRPARARKMRRWVRPAAMLVFAIVVVGVLGPNVKLLLAYASQALLPVASAFSAAVALAWVLARVTRLMPGDRRAVAMEVGMQNIPLALGMAMTFFPTLGGVAITAVTWGAFHLIGGFACAATWSRVPTAA
jgi:BASS family bile acid:Na+ symporter